MPTPSELKNLKLTKDTSTKASQTDLQRIDATQLPTTKPKERNKLGLTIDTKKAEDHGKRKVKDYIIEREISPTTEQETTRQLLSTSEQTQPKEQSLNLPNQDAFTNASQALKDLIKGIYAKFNNQ